MNHNRPIIFLLLLLHPWTATAQQSPTSPTNNSNIDPYANSDFNQSIVIVLVLIGSSFFIVIFYTIIRQFAGDRNGDAVNRGTGGFRSQRINRGIEASALEAFPTFLYSDVKGLKLGNDTLVCAICINEFEDDKTLRLLPKCDHVFHTDCIDTWLATHTTCPVCRSNLVPDPPRIIPPAAVEESADHVAVRIEEEVVDPTPSSSLLLPLKRNWSGSTRRFPRSHSTGHSVVAPGENCVRFTLRLPEHVRREIFVGGRFHQSKSLLSSPTERAPAVGAAAAEEVVRRGATAVEVVG
ncbi:E3 ubiquitin-protein ligase ATL6 [Acorus calamus]|uniref:RING-type E3 ubiquitin transferase n=1 Tax=Acorus calamus TaxID=4465 RepID=A0AAV9CIP5_ACOCL|nr:E3 ubiquitin-protein ligase ATL6 [Acorus calamus]